MSQWKTSSKGRISCSEFCGCRNEWCRNKWNMMRGDGDDNDSVNDDSDDENNDFFFLSEFSFTDTDNS